MSNKKFTADVDAFAKLTKDKMLKVAKQSIQDVMLDAQTPVAKGGRMPVDTGFLRNSIVSGIEGSTSNEGNDAITFTIAGMDLGDVLTFAWTAEYALRRHYGFNGTDSLGRTYSETGALWRDAAAAKWQQTVRKNAFRVS